MNQSSDSHSDFKIDLPYSVHFPEDTVAYIDDICIPVSWYTEDESRNNKFHFRIGPSSHVATTAGNYSITGLHNIF